MYGLSGCGGNRSIGWRLSVLTGCRVVVLSGFRVVVGAGTGTGTGTGTGAGAAVVVVAVGIVSVRTPLAAGRWPLAGWVGVRATFRSRDATAFDTSAQTTAAMIRVAASRKCFRQFIVGVTCLPARMLRHHSTRRSTIVEYASSCTCSPARLGSRSRRSGTASLVLMIVAQRSPHGPVGRVNSSASWCALNRM